MSKYKKVNMFTYIANVTANHWYYGSYSEDFVIDLSNPDDNDLSDILRDILENEPNFRYINWDNASISVNFIIDKKVYTKTVVIE